MNNMRQKARNLDTDRLLELRGAYTQQSNDLRLKMEGQLNTQEWINLRDQNAALLHYIVIINDELKRRGEYE